MTKQCELCEQPARVSCESDQASLCWDCDAKVHGANFLVGRHTRCLLCRSCQAPTPWRASGPRLSPTFSACERCLGAGVEGEAYNAEKREVAGDGARVEAETAGNGDLGVADDGDDEEEEKEDDEDEGEAEEEDEEEDEEEEEDDEDGDNQVVPWSTDSAAATPPPVASCSSSEESSSGRRAIGKGFLKRMRGGANPSTSHLQANLVRGCSTSQPGHPSRTFLAASEEHETETTSSSDGSLRYRKKAAPPPGPVPRHSVPPRDRRPRGSFSAVDFFLPSSFSPPI